MTQQIMQKRQHMIVFINERQDKKCEELQTTETEDEQEVPIVMH